MPLQSIRLAVPPASLGAWQIDVAERRGLFRQQGLAVERGQLDGDKLTDALTARERDVVLAPTDVVIKATRAGNLVMIAGAVNRAAFSLVGAIDVAKIEDLKGKPIGVRDQKDISAAILRRVMRARGLADGDYTLIGFADAGVRAAAIANGTVGGSLVDPGRSARLQASGFKLLANAFEVVPTFQAEVLAVRSDWARQNEDRLVRFLRAIVEADRWIYASANRREAVDILAGTLGLTAVEAERVYEQYVEKQPAIPRAGELEQPGVRTVIELMGEVDALPRPLPDPASLTDTGYLQRAR